MPGLADIAASYSMPRSTPTENLAASIASYGAQASAPYDPRQQTLLEQSRDPRWYESRYYRYPQDYVEYRNGGRVSAPGARGAYQQMGIPPVLQATSPWAQTAFRFYPDVYGDMGVQHLVGFNSPFPYVLRGVYGGADRGWGMLASMLPPWPWGGMMGMMPMGYGAMPQAPAAPRVRGTGQPKAKNTNTNTNTSTPPVQPTPGFVGPMLPGYQDPLEPGSGRMTARSPYPSYQNQPITPEMQARIEAEARARGYDFGSSTAQQSGEVVGPPAPDWWARSGAAPDWNPIWRNPELYTTPPLPDVAPTPSAPPMTQQDIAEQFGLPYYQPDSLPQVAPVAPVPQITPTPQAVAPAPSVQTPSNLNAAINRLRPLY